LSTATELHQVPYRRYLSEQFSIAYDIYLEIVYLIDKKLKSALGRDTPNWHLVNCCPACFYQLLDEPELLFAFLCEMDANNSLRRTNAFVRQQIDRQDTRTTRSDLWISPEEVDRFGDEARSRPVIPSQPII
jgi:hypothetical protein